MEYSLKDKTILRIALITSIIGLFCLFLLMFFKSEQFIKINDVSDYLDQNVAMEGVAGNFTYRNNNTRFLLYQECAIEIVSFEKTIDKNVSGKKIILYGKPQEYNDKISIIADKIVIT